MKRVALLLMALLCALALDVRAHQRGEVAGYQVDQCDQIKPQRRIKYEDRSTEGTVDGSIPPRIQVPVMECLDETSRPGNMETHVRSMVQVLVVDEWPTESARRQSNDQDAK